jgi:hypothetical protein
MSHHTHVNDLASSFVAMAAAYERLPQLEHEIRSLKQAHEVDLDTIQMLELRIIDLKNEIETKNASIRALEVSRDDAELRFLECDDAKASLVRAVQAMLGEGQGILQAIMPVPEPTPEPVAVMPLVDGSLSSPFEPSMPPGPFADTVASDALSSSADTTTSEPVMGQSEVDPTAVPVEVIGGGTESSTASSNDSVSVPSGPFPATADPVSPTETSDPGASVPSTATPSADATSEVDPEPQKYVSIGVGIAGMNPDWISWFNRHGATTQLG